MVAWTSQGHDRAIVGLAADAALAIVELAEDDAGVAPAGVIGREVALEGRTVRVLNLEGLGR